MSDDSNHNSGRGGHERGRNDRKNHHGRCRCCPIPLSRAGMITAFAYRTSKVTTPSMLCCIGRWCRRRKQCVPCLLQPGRYRIPGDDGAWNQHTPRCYSCSARRYSLPHTIWCPTNLGFVNMRPPRSTAACVPKDRAASLAQDRRLFSHFLYGMTEVS